MPELTKADYLKVGQYVFLKGRWRSVGGAYLEDALFKVKKADAFNYTKAYIMKQGESGTISFDDDLKLYPENYDTLYEIGVGMIGNGKLFVRIPSDRYYHYLESEGVLTSVDATTEVGGYTEEDIPPVEPKILREYTIRDMRDTIKYTLVNSSHKDEKIIIKFTVNKVKLEDVSADERALIEQNWDDYVAKGLLRIIRYPREGS